MVKISHREDLSALEQETLFIETLRAFIEEPDETLVIFRSLNMENFFSGYVSPGRLEDISQWERALELLEGCPESRYRDVLYFVCRFYSLKTGGALLAPVASTFTPDSNADVVKDSYIKHFAELRDFVPTTGFGDEGPGHDAAAYASLSKAVARQELVGNFPEDPLVCAFGQYPELLRPVLAAIAVKKIKEGPK